MWLYPQEDIVKATYHIVKAQDLLPGDVIRLTRAVVDHVETVGSETSIWFRGRSYPGVNAASKRIGVERRP